MNVYKRIRVPCGDISNKKVTKHISLTWPKINFDLEMLLECDWCNRTRVCPWHKKIDLNSELSTDNTFPTFAWLNLWKTKLWWWNLLKRNSIWLEFKICISWNFLFKQIFLPIIFSTIESQQRNKFLCNFSLEWNENLLWWESSQKLFSICYDDVQWGWIFFSNDNTFFTKSWESLKLLSLNVID